MDREILFRAKGQTSDKWHEGFLTRLDTDVCHIKDKKRTEWICDSSTVCQYTGLTDKYGRKFEGDIFQADDDECIQRYVIVWDNDSLEWQAHNIVDSCGPLSLSEFRSEDIQVIGNIFDNPELLEGGKS